VFDRRSDPTALLILLRQFCLARPPVLDVRLDCLVTREPPSVEADIVVPVRGVSGAFGDTALEGILKVDLGYPRMGLVGLNGMEYCGNHGSRLSKNISRAMLDIVAFGIAVLVRVLR
jgi:hypothetical protein